MKRPTTNDAKMGARLFFFFFLFVSLLFTQKASAREKSDEIRFFSPTHTTRRDKSANTYTRAVLIHKLYEYTFYSSKTTTNKSITLSLSNSNAAYATIDPPIRFAHHNREPFLQKRLESGHLPKSNPQISSTNTSSRDFSAPSRSSSPTDPD